MQHLLAAALMAIRFLWIWFFGLVVFPNLALAHFLCWTSSWDKSIDAHSSEPNSRCCRRLESQSKLAHLLLCSTSKASDNWEVFAVDFALTGRTFSSAGSEAKLKKIFVGWTRTTCSIVLTTNICRAMLSKTDSTLVCASRHGLEC